MKLTRLANVPAALRRAAADLFERQRLRRVAARLNLQAKRIAAWLSQGVNCVFLIGHHDQTVSARCYVEYRLRHNRRWAPAYHAINAVFRVAFSQDDHCLDSFLEDVDFAEEVVDAYGGRMQA